MFSHSVQTKLFLNQCYTEPGRYYHDINHIKYLVSRLNTYFIDAVLTPYKSNKITQEQYKFTYNVCVEAREAIWWHDSWYSIWSEPGMNESESAKTFNDFVNTGGIIGMNEPSRSRIEKAILATADHLFDQELTDDDIVTKLMLDVDMCGFAKNYDSVRYDSENVLKELLPKGYSDIQLLNGRIGFLEQLQKRKRIFYTDYFFDKCEKDARTNIAKSIEDSKYEIAHKQLMEA